MIRSLRIRSSVLAWLCPILAMLPVRLTAQQSRPIAVGGSFTYVRTNVLPGCDCFNTFGGSGEIQVGLSTHLSLLGDVTATRQGDITARHYTLTQTTFTAGLRYASRPFSERLRLQPFGDLLLGGAHAGGSLSPANTREGSATTFAFQTGGGLMVPLNHRWRLVPIQAQYLLTTFGNGADNHQNDLRLSTGVLFTLKR